MAVLESPARSQNVVEERADERSGALPSAAAAGSPAGDLGPEEEERKQEQLQAAGQ